MDNVIKQGYLKKSRPTAPGSNPANSFLQLFEPTRWFVFGLRNRRPYLEYYEKEQHVFTAQPINSFDLYTCTKVTYTLGRNNRNWTFCLFLQDRVLELTADCREMMLSWCRTLEHTLQNYGALKNVPSEHIYSDYPVKYKPRQPISPPVEDRRSATPTPPPSEPAPPVPQEIAFEAANAPSIVQEKKRASGYWNSGWNAPEKSESEHSEPDTSEDDFVTEEFFKQKKLEAFASSTLKPGTVPPLILPSRSVATLPSRAFSLHSECPDDIPEVPLRPQRTKPVQTGVVEAQYSQVNKTKSEPITDDTYETAFDIGDRNTLTEQSASIIGDMNDDMYEVAFDRTDTHPLLEKGNSQLSVELPKRLSKFEDLEKISEKRKSQIESEQNLYSDFESVVSQAEAEQNMYSDFELEVNNEVMSDGNKRMSNEKIADLKNNNIKTENPYSNVNASLNDEADLRSKVQQVQNLQGEHLYDNTESCLNTEHPPNGANVYVALSYDTKSSPIKPPRRGSRNKSTKATEQCYANLPLADSGQLKPSSTDHSKPLITSEQSTQILKSEYYRPEELNPVSDSIQLPVRIKAVQENIYDFEVSKPSQIIPTESIPLPVRSKVVQENIYDFGRITVPEKNDENKYQNSNKVILSDTSENKNEPRRKNSRYNLPPPLNIGLDHKRSASSSPDTPRQQSDTPTNKDPTKDGHLEQPPSPASPSTPVNKPVAGFHKSFITVTDLPHVRQSTPSPQPLHGRKKSYSPKVRHTDDVNPLSQLYDSVPTKQSFSRSQERPRSLIMTQETDQILPSSQPIRKNTGESLYSPVLNKKWFGSPMPGVYHQPASNVVSQPATNLKSQPMSGVPSQANSNAYFQPIVNSATDLRTTTDTAYEVPKRSCSVKQHEPQPTFINKNIPLVINGGSSSPSHDGFQFNVPNKNEDDDDDEPHDYEDATMMHGEPPIPPRRKPPTNIPARSQSVYVPCNINQDPGSRVIVRQTSLRERQRITATPGTVTVLPLKQSEIEILQEEQQSHGIIVKISPAACQRIALVDSFKGIWIVGWDFKHYPRLSESIHIGDEVTKINDIRVTSAHMARKTLKGCNTEQVDLVIKRLPYAQVMAICRHHNGENLGVQRLGGTAEITYVDPSGLAAAHGLPKHAKCIEEDSFCNWWITEINNRPLNLSFKGNEIEARLNAVGKDISIVVQPSDFVKELKKQLKKMRNFKEFLAV